MTEKAQPLSYIFFLGSHPILSRLEVLRVLAAHGHSSPSGAKLAQQGGPTVVEETEQYLIVQVTEPLDEQLQDILGGSDRFAEELGRLPKLPTGPELGQLLSSPSEAKLAQQGGPTKKINLGLSGIGVNARDLRTMGESFKEWWQTKGGKLRYVIPQGKALRLNAAQVMAYKLDRPPNTELTLVRLRDGSIGVFRTVAVQDISAYEIRDTKRPVRDPSVGMLPPKLAQIMLNLALPFSLDREKDGMRVAHSESPHPSPLPAWGEGNLTILDPFCGMGTILQEGWLADHTMVGSDSSERMIRASEKNLTWLQQHFTLSDSQRPHLFVHQANTRWSKRWHGVFDAVVTEPFLGKPLKKPLPQAQLQRHMNDLGGLYRRVFASLKPVLKEGGSVVFALPAFRVERGGDEWQLFPEAFLDALSRLGYSKDQLETTDRSELLYARPQALVGRELTAWHKTT